MPNLINHVFNAHPWLACNPKAFTPLINPDPSKSQSQVPGKEKKKSNPRQTHPSKILPQTRKFFFTS